MSVDVLAFTIELPDGKYASVNRIQRGWTDPRKSDIYRAVYDAVLEAAKAEIARTVWSTAECECFATIMRVMPAHWRADAMNLGKPEFDALTEAGVWTDDRLANPCLPWIRYDDDGPHRVTIVVMKLYQPANVAIAAKPKAGRLTKSAQNGVKVDKFTKLQNGAKSASELTERRKYDGGPLAPDEAVVDGFVVSKAEALAEVQRHFGKRAS